MTIAKVAALSGLMVLGACSSDNSTGNSEVGIMAGMVKSRFARKSAAPVGNPLAGITRAQLADIPGPLLLVHLEKTGAYASLSKIGDNGGVETFMTADQVSLSIKDGVIVATRGLGADVLSSDTSGSLDALVSHQRQDYQRVYKRLNGEDQIVTETYSCTLENTGRAPIEIVEARHATDKTTESCTGSTGSFRNDYWMTRRDHVVWKSRQWLGDELEYVTIQLLVK